MARHKKHTKIVSGHKMHKGKKGRKRGGRKHGRGKK
jgi:hypothetical protein